MLDDPSPILQGRKFDHLPIGAYIIVDNLIVTSPIPKYVAVESWKSIDRTWRLYFPIDSEHLGIKQSDVVETLSCNKPLAIQKLDFPYVLRVFEFINYSSDLESLQRIDTALLPLAYN